MATTLALALLMTAAPHSALARTFEEVMEEAKTAKEAGDTDRAVALRNGVRTGFNVVQRSVADNTGVARSP